MTIHEIIVLILEIPELIRRVLSTYRRIFKNQQRLINEYPFKKTKKAHQPPIKDKVDGLSFKLNNQ